ncbi:unnamed protein product, partial [Darwinula stevensoni]
ILKNTLIIFAHPYLEHSQSNKELLNFYVRHHHCVFRDLYEEFPDFHIPAFRERKRLKNFDRIIFHFPLIWFGIPPLLKLWIDEVFDLKWQKEDEENPLKNKEAIILINMETGVAMTILIFLGAAITMAPLAKKLGFSSVIGYILGGIIIGPFVLQLTGDNTDGIMHATEFGVVLLLTGARAQKILGHAKKNTRIRIGTDAFNSAITSRYFLFCRMGKQSSFGSGFVFCTFFHCYGFANFTGKGSHQNQFGRSRFFHPIISRYCIYTHFGHFASYCQNRNRSREKSYEFADTTTTRVVTTFFNFIRSEFIFVPFLRYVSKSNMSELLTATSLFLIIGVSELMITIGLSPALGAFIAGVMLANSEFRHELESHVDPFKGLFLAVFFVSVGASIDFDVVFQNPLFILSLTIVVILVKFMVLVIVGKVFSLSWDQNLWFAFALAQVGEFAFVLLNYSMKLFLISPELNAQMVAVTAISMCFTPILLVIYDKLILPRFLQTDNHNKEPTDTENPEHHKIIIIGFGYFGSAVGRLLRANNIKATILDHDSDRVKLLRSYGMKVYYGDATRVQILKTAGAETAEILVLCLDDPENNQNIVELAKTHFPHLKIFVRAKNRMDAYELINKGVENIYRETLGTAVEMAIDVLQATGMRRYAARRLGKRFENLDKA